MSAAVVAFGAVSALGEGEAAASPGAAGERARVVIARDEELATAGLARPFAARARVDAGTGDRATALLAHALADCASDLDRAMPGWQNERVGLALGTSSGGMRSAEGLFRRVANGAPESPADAARATYFAPMHDAARSSGLSFEPATLILGACAAATIAIGLGTRWLEEDACDIVLAGGFDAVSVFVAAGFEVLRATSAEVPPRPFRMNRDGMALGEGAALLALVRPSRAPRALAYVAGFGASADGVHLTAPDRTGGGLARAAKRALEEALEPRVDIVSAHGTATPFNDAAESRAIALLLGPSSEAVVHPFKAQVGHTLGAAGALESLACIFAFERGLFPGAAGSGAIDPDAPARLLDVTTPGDPKVALKLSAAFGGANAALVLTRSLVPTRARVRREAFLGPAVHVEHALGAPALSAATGVPPDRIARGDELTRLALSAVARLVSAHGSLAGAGIVVAQSFATLETNALFDERIHERGARMAEPRRFPYTSPNAAPGECGVAFGLTGPCFGVGSGLHAALEAIAAAALLVRAGDADRVVVIAVDEVGSVVRRIAETGAFGDVRPVSGAIAVLVTAEALAGAAQVGRLRVGMGARTDRRPTPPGHLALLPLVRGAHPSSLEATHGDGAWGAHASLELLPVPP